MRRVLDGELDFAMVPSTELPAGLTGRFIGHDREMLVSSATNAIGHKHLREVPLNALSGKRLIVPSRLNVRRKSIDTLLNTHNIQIAETLEMDGMLATLEMIAATDWVAMLPSAICYPDKDGAIRHLNPIKDPPIGLDYILVEKAESAPPRAAQLLANCLTQHLSDVLSEWSKKFDMRVPKS
jgi:DNA-binding transcriptional LysR family regulator